jgi:ribosomal protein S18 acetylase RimI-like enzyme
LDLSQYGWDYGGGVGCMRDVVLQDYQRGDEEMVKQLLHELNREIEAADPQKLIKNKPGADEYFVKQVLDLVETKQGFVVLAFRSGQAVGMVVGYVTEQDEEEKLDMKPAQLGYISELYVRQAYRGKGLGGRLLAIAEERLRERGCNLVKLEVFVPTSRSVQFYRQNGYGEREVVMMKEL